MAEDEGSSPRVRGKPPAQSNSGREGGLIPARAGKTLPVMKSAKSRAAHPRACGENRVRILAADKVRGSSPRVRGKLAPSPPACGAPGLIPARAGKTSVRLKIVRRLGAHPRACGENRRLPQSKADCPGSSPRVRGKRAIMRPRFMLGRLIPARAGKTVGGGPGAATWKAHPRACGENASGSSAPFTVMGSSPRVRGKPD